VIGGGVTANKYLRKKMRILTKKYKGAAHFPSLKILTGDNAAMIGIAAWKKAERGLFSASVEREPRMQISPLANEK